MKGSMSAIGCVVLVALATITMTASIRADAAEPRRSLTFEERVEAQRAIEQVYWDQRSWPRAETPKPALAQVLSDPALEAAVRDYLRKSAALEKLWDRPVGAVELQAELDRMIRQTRAPETLSELFSALGHDAYLIAETLARQTLVDRLARNWYVTDSRLHGRALDDATAALEASPSADDWKNLGGVHRTLRLVRESDATAQLEPGSTVLDDEEWKAVTGLLSDRLGEALPVGNWSDLREERDAFVTTRILERSPTGITAETMSWPKRSFDDWWSDESGALSELIQGTDGDYTANAPNGTGGCDSTAWKTLSGMPTGRNRHTAVWTGSEMIVWGGGFGVGQGGFGFDTGGRYDPATDTWQEMSTVGAPSPRVDHAMIWTGSEVIVWGGRVGAEDGGTVATGGRYDPSTDSWQPTATAGAPQGREMHTAVWTGSEMIVWGGQDVTGGVETLLGDGAGYDPSTDSWSVIDSAGAPTARTRHTTVWTGDAMIVWGGSDATTQLDSGGRYDPATDSWSATSSLAPPRQRTDHSAVWTGTTMIVWGGYMVMNGTQNLSSGSTYDPVTDVWTPMAVLDAPTGRYDHTSVWTGSEMVVYGGSSFAGELSTGGSYDPVTDTWSFIDASQAPGARTDHTAVWTGTEMIVWGGSDKNLATGIEYYETGGRYDPVSDSWVATLTVGTPTRRAWHTTVWTGAEMIAWGGSRYGDGYFSSGGCYDPVTDVWTPTSNVGAPDGRRNHSAIWTGTEMIVWGGYLVNTTQGAVRLKSGGRYSPLTDTWVATNESAAPMNRHTHTAVWTGTEMIVFGGGTTTGVTNSGSRYDPTTDTWNATALTDAPGARYKHTALWTGSQMLVWGGGGEFDPRNTGGLYDPAADTWIATSVVGAPAERLSQEAVWTGSEMIVWGGRDASNAPLGDGAIYDPGTDTWSQVASAGEPPAAENPVAAWTGSHMLVWGGVGVGGVEVSTGGLYHPATDSWTPTPAAQAPRGRHETASVWTGSEFLVFGGETYPAAFWGDGGRLCALDTDADGAFDDQDCASGDASVWSVPGSVGPLVLSGAGDTQIMWQPPASTGGVGVSYDVLRADYATGFGDPMCVATDVAGTSAVDSDPPLTNTGFFYIVITKNACGSNVGAGSDGSARPVDACP